MIVLIRPVFIVDYPTGKNKQPLRRNPGKIATTGKDCCSPVGCIIFSLRSDRTRGDMSQLILIFSAGSILLIALSIPLIKGKVPPNGLYGFRIPLTMNSPEIWYPANRYAGKWLLGSAIFLLVASIGLPILPGMTMDSYAICVALIALGMLTCIFIFSWLYARKLAGHL